MTTRYQSEHYEDVARLLEGNTLLSDSHKINKLNLVGAFADLFAADNPRRCTAHVACPYRYSDGRDNDCHVYGFNREQFLAACGLESEG
ncbi:hypothetical protein LCGC14_1313210 [marine sediment metagenome]|uniref:Uncharacterized protein n=1 Tax=marine sediment metagenome TaxID=412755 RepID=A0A0F9KM97_9ZZZZ